MRTIQGRFIALIITVVVVSVGIVGIVATSTFVAKTDSDTASIVTLTCQNEAKFIDTTLESLETSVDIAASYAESTLDSAERLFGDGGYRQTYTDDVERLFVNIAENTDGAVAFYYRYNAETAGSTDGFLYVRNGVSEPFEKIPPTDIKLFDPNDVEHVGWYYIPLENGRASWLKPYQNQNLDIYMISYVVPLYENGQFIGVIGMDVNFQVIINQLSTIHPLNNGCAFICDDDGTVMFHPELEYGEKMDDVAQTKGASFKKVLEWDNNGGELVEYTRNGIEKEMAFQRLLNGMTLATVANTSDIMASRNTLVLNIVVATVFILLIAVLVAWILGRRISRPLNDLTEAARQVAAGNLDVKLPQAKLTEISTFVDAYETTVDHMRFQMKRIEQLAQHDELTKLWNTAAYDGRVAILQDAIDGGSARFALVVVDVNDLKYMNDMFGHAYGNEYLVCASRVLADVFGETAVYRVGGDEFVVIVEDDGLDSLDERLAEMDTKIDSASAVRDLPEEKKPWTHASMAYGCVSFDPKLHHSVEDVFKEADVAMYDMKRAMKCERMG